MLISIGITFIACNIVKIFIIYFTGINVFTDYLHVYSFIHYLLLPVLLLAIHTEVFTRLKGFILNFITNIIIGSISISVVVSLGFMFRIVC